MNPDAWNAYRPYIFVYNIYKLLRVRDAGNDPRLSGVLDFE